MQSNYLRQLLGDLAEANLLHLAHWQGIAIADECLKPLALFIECQEDVLFVSILAETLHKNVDGLTLLLTWTVSAGLCDPVSRGNLRSPYPVILIIVEEKVVTADYVSHNAIQNLVSWWLVQLTQLYQCDHLTFLYADTEIVVEDSKLNWSLLELNCFDLAHIAL